MNLNDWFNKGMTTDEYIESMKVNKESMLTIYGNYTFSGKIEDQGALRAIVLTEDWCGDAMLNNAILLKLAEAGGIELRFLARDQNLELMDQYLTNGTSRAIPIFIFIDENGEEAGVWGPRAAKVQVLVEEMRAGLPDKESPDFAEKQKEMYGELMGKFQNDQDIWSEVEESILSVLHK